MTYTIFFINTFIINVRERHWAMPWPEGFLRRQKKSLPYQFFSPKKSLPYHFFSQKKFLPYQLFFSKKSLFSVKVTMIKVGGQENRVMHENQHIFVFSSSIGSHSIIFITNINYEVIKVYFTFYILAITWNIEISWKF